MHSPKTIVPRSEGEKLLSLSTREAEKLFQSYGKQQQLEILNATRNPKAREQLYYLVPDCTELIQESPTEDVLQVLDTMLGTGLAFQTTNLKSCSTSLFGVTANLMKNHWTCGSLNFLSVIGRNSDGSSEN